MNGPSDTQKHAMGWAYLFGGAFLAALGCGGADLRSIGHDDVAGIPPGTATGALYAGQHLVTSGRKIGYRCRAGDCATLVSPYVRADETERIGSAKTPAPKAPRWPVGLIGVGSNFDTDRPDEDEEIIWTNRGEHTHVH